jgi:hypothetical protein
MRGSLPIGVILRARSVPKIVPLVIEGIPVSMIHLQSRPPPKNFVMQKYHPLPLATTRVWNIPLGVKTGMTAQGTPLEPPEPFKVGIVN